MKTGRLAGSITYAVHGQKEDAASIPQAPAKRDDVVSMPATFHTLYVGTNVEYAPYVEYGYKVHVRGGFWRKEGRRFLTEAFDESKSKFQGTLNKAIHAAVLKHGK